MAAQARRSQAERSTATTQHLVEVARALFATEGYAQTSTEEVVRRAGVTRGALYHHFGSKEGIFVAVLDAVQGDVARQVAAAALGESDAFEQLRAGCHAFLNAALDPRVQRIALIDAPSVLGWDTWREQDAAHSQRLLHLALEDLSARGIISGISPVAATYLLSGAMNEAALWIARANPIEPALDAALHALDRLLDGLRVGAP